MRLTVCSLLLAIVQAAAASVETPDGFVHRVYARYRSDGPGVLMSRRGGAAFYTAALLDGFAEDQAGAQSEGLAIDGDPICGCTNYDLHLKAVVVTPGAADTVKARVSFTNFGEAQTVTLTLSKTPAGWRIADVRAKNIKSILALLQEPSAHPIGPATPHETESLPPKR